MWQRLSIRTQLILMMSGLLSIVGLGTLGLVNWFDIKERQSLAIEQADTLGRSLNNDLLNALINTNADTLSNISLRIEGFKSVDALQLYNVKNEAVFSYGENTYIKENLFKELSVKKSFFDVSGRLFIKTSILADDYPYGSSIIVINPEQYNTRVKENFMTLLWIFPVELIIGIFIAWRISLHYSKPFEVLATAMQENDIENNAFKRVDTQSKNEVGMLFSGYNAMMTAIIKKTEVLRYQSHHDSLTGLYNRYAIEKDLTLILHNDSYPSNVLINLDLDKFKSINDSAGHVAGDELLQLVGHTIKQSVPKDACVARIGGDDFFILLKDASEDKGLAIVKTLQKKFSDFRFVWQGETISTSATMGVVVFKPFEYTLTELIKTADIAFYNAKAKGQNKIHVYDENDKDEEQITTEIQIAKFIKEALNKGPSRFELYAQAIVPLQREPTKSSYEVLIRMFDSDGNFLAPDSFLPIAERYQLMVDIDKHVLITYLEFVAKNPSHLDDLEFVHINLAGGTLNQKDFQDCVKDAIGKYNFPWPKLELEITESSSIGNLLHAEEFINFCKQHGIGFALDDFGTGMSSFEYLKNLPFDVVKIDGSFVREMLTDPVDHAMIRYTHEISKLRNQETVAEYVETQADVDELRKIGITYGQGYFLGKPKPLVEWLKNKNA
ncbi:MAG: EAL domain-containing protein [Woeseiaceae bacterium]